MGNTSHLYQLIKSMSRSEKGYFKKVYSQSGLGKKNQYIELFDAIDAQGDYDSVVLEVQFAKQFSQLPVAKNYLFKILLKSLRSYHSQGSVDIELSEIMINIELLYGKRLLDACRKELEKAEQLIIKNEVPQKFPELARWKKLLFNQTGKINEGRDSLHLKEKQYIDVIDNLTDYSYLSYRLFSAYTQTGMAREPEMLKLSDEIIRHPLLKDVKMAKSIRAKSFFYNIHAKYHEIRNDFVKTHQYNKLFIDLLESNPSYIHYNLSGYVPGLYNLLLSSVRTREHVEFTRSLEKLKAIPEKYKVSEELTFTVRLMALNIELFYLLIMGDFEGSLLVARQTKAVLKNDTGNQPPQLYVELYYFIAYSYFGTGRYDKALVWLNRIINNSSYFPREDMLCYARILNLICHFEIGNERFVEYNLKSTYRFLSKMNKVYEFETIILSFIKAMLKVPGYNLLHDKMLELRGKLVKISTDRYEQNAFEYFDFIGWLDSKLQERKFSEVVKEKNRLPKKKVKPSV